MADQSTKQLVEIADIQDAVIVLKNRSLRMVLEVSAINFELRSEEEQNAILQNFQSFLNSIDFPVQIVVGSRRYNINEYLKNIADATSALTNELLKIQGAEYIKFIKELSELSNIMSKRFFIVIPFYIFDVPRGKGLLGGIKSIFSTSSQSAAYSPVQMETYKNQLLQRAELIFDGLVGLGLKTQVLGKDALIDLFADLYNAGSKPATS